MAVRAECNLILLDLVLPGPDGFEILAKVRETRPTLPVIILTADATREALRRCEEAGADDYLTKPVESRRLLAEIARLSRKHRQAAVHPRQATLPTQEAPVEDDVLIDEKALQGLLGLGSGVEFFEELVDSFSRDVQALMKKMRGAINDHDYPVLQDAAHAIRGSASEFGARRMVNLCLRIRELKPYDMTSAQPAQLLEDLQEAFASSRILLDEFTRRRREARQ